MNTLQIRYAIKFIVTTALTSIRFELFLLYTCIVFINFKSFTHLNFKSDCFFNVCISDANQESIIQDIRNGRSRIPAVCIVCVINLTRLKNYRPCRIAKKKGQWCY